jgi:hypothetical protein
VKPQTVTPAHLWTPLQAATELVNCSCCLERVPFCAGIWIVTSNSVIATSRSFATKAFIAFVMSELGITAVSGEVRLK